MTDNPKGEFIWRMLGSILGSFCREFGVEYMKTIVKYIADNDEFWNLQGLLARTDPGDRPFERGAHDFLTDKPTGRCPKCQGMSYQCVCYQDAPPGEPEAPEGYRRGGSKYIESTFKTPDNPPPVPGEKKTK